MRRLFRGSGQIVLVIALLAAFIAVPPGPLAAADKPRPAVAPPAFAPDQLLVGFLPRLASPARAATVAQRGGRLLSTIESIDVAVVRIPPGRTVAEEAAAYLESGLVRFAEPNFIAKPLAAPNDPGFGSQWSLHNTGQVVEGVAGTPDADIDAPEAWEVTRGSRNIVVGVLDSGVDYTHPDLAANIWRAPAGFNVNGCGPGSVGFRSTGGTQDCNPIDLDDIGHGTVVAGIIGATGDNGGGVTGVNWQVSIMPIKVCEVHCLESDRIAGIDFAIRAKGAGVNLRVLNNSNGGPVFSQAHQAILAQANANNILFVAAAGNDSANNDLIPLFPTNYSLPNVISVAATDSADNLASFSNFGPVNVDLGAPGVAIRSTLPGNAYVFSPGTSVATPHVAGAAALVLAAPGLGNLTAAQLKARLLNCGDPVPALAARTLSGKRLNVARAISNACPASYTLTVGPNVFGSGSVGVSPPGPAYAAGATATFTATPAGGFDFHGWSIDGTFSVGTNPLPLSVYANHTVSAIFIPAVTGNFFPGITVGALPFADTRSNVGASFQPGEQGNCASSGASLWYSYTAATTTQLTVSTAGSDFDTVVDVWTGDAAGALAAEFWACNDQFGGTDQSSVTFTAVAGTTYRVRIGGYHDGTAPATGNLSVSFSTATPAAPAVFASANALQFTPQGVGVTSAARQVTLTNNGGASLTISSLAFAGAHPGDFARTTTCPLNPLSLAAGDDCTIDVTFTPAALGEREAVLDVRTDLDDSPHEIFVEGIGTAPAVSLSQSTLAFGNQTVGFTSAPQSLTLANYGGLPLTVNAIDVSADFARTTTCPLSPATLASGGTCTIAVTFSPTTPGLWNGTLMIGDNAAGTPHTIVLTGTGVAASPRPSPSPSPSPSPQVTLTVQIAGDGGVTVIPPGGTAANGATFQYPAGTVITVMPQPAAGQTFTGWTWDGQPAGWAGALDITMAASHTLGATFVPTPGFPDVAAGQPYTEAVTQLKARNTIKGYEDGTYGPDDQTLRAQMAALIARAMGYTDSPLNPFTDRCDPANPANCVDDELWNRVAELASRNIARGYTDAATCAPSATPCYAPRDFVLHAQVLSFITRAMVDAGYWTQQPIDPGPYSGVLTGTGHEQDVATFVHYTQVVGGVPDYPTTGDFPAWDQPATRGWFARALWAALNSYWIIDRVP